MEHTTSQPPQTPKTYDANPFVYLAPAWQRFRATNLSLTIVLAVINLITCIGLGVYANSLLERWYGTHISAQNIGQLLMQIGVGIGIFAILQLLLGIAVSRTLFAGSQGQKLSASQLLPETLKRLPIVILTGILLFVALAFVIGIVAVSGLFVHPALAIFLGLLCVPLGFLAWFFLIPLRVVLVDDIIPRSPVSALKTSFTVAKRASVAVLVLAILYGAVSGTVSNIQQFVPMPGSDAITQIQSKADSKETPTKAEVLSAMKFVEVMILISIIPGLIAEYGYVLGLAELYSRIKKEH